MIELAIVVKNSEQSLTQKHLIHQEGLCLSHDDITLANLVKQAQDAFGEGADDILVKIKYTW